MVLHKENSTLNALQLDLTADYDTPAAKVDDSAVRSHSDSTRESILSQLGDLIAKLGKGHSPDRESLAELQGMEVGGVMKIVTMPNSKTVVVELIGAAKELFGAATAWLYQTEHKPGVRHGRWVKKHAESGKELVLDMTGGTLTASLN